MKLIVLRLVLALAAFIVVPDALAADSGNFFLDAQFGHMSETYPTTVGGTAFNQAHGSWGAGGGYLWKQSNGSSLGIELGYVELGKKIADYYGDAFSLTSGTISNAKLMTAGLRFEYPLPAKSHLIYQARIGLVSAQYDETDTSNYPFNMYSHSGSTSDGGYYYGVGGGYLVTQSLSITLSYTSYIAGPLNVDWIGLETEYRF